MWMMVKQTITAEKVIPVYVLSPEEAENVTSRHFMNADLNSYDATIKEIEMTDEEGNKYVYNDKKGEYECFSL